MLLLKNTHKKFMVINKKILFSAELSKLINRSYLKEGIGLPEIILLCEVLIRKHNKEKLPNVKWLQTELQISFTKVKAILDNLINKKMIVKIYGKNDKRVKRIDITGEGMEFFERITKSLPS